MIYHANVTLHVLAALLWLGGMFFLAAVGAPVLRTVEPKLRAQLFQALGVRFRFVGWVAIAVLLLTGFVNLHFRSLLRWELLGSGPFWMSGYGRALAVKLITVALMLLLAAIHDFGVGPAAGRAEAGSARALALGRATAWIARLNVVLGLVLVIAAVRIAR